MSKKIEKVSTWIIGASLLSLFVLALVDLFVAESVPIVVYGILGGIALGADSETIPAIFGIRKGKDE